MKLKLVDKIDQANGTKSFIFETSKDISWLPGQYYYFTVLTLTHPDPKGATRHFTIHLSPTEGKRIGFTTRMRSESGYKQSLDAIKIGTEFDGEGPEGTYILDENENPPAGGEHVLLAGGIGITPFRAFIKYNVDKGLKDIKIHLIYANSKPAEIAFRRELEDWAKVADNIQVSFTVSEPDKSWKGLVGRIDEAMVKKLTSNFKDPTYWLCGPPGMVGAMNELMAKMNIPSSKVRSEKFSGY